MTTRTPRRISLCIEPRERLLSDHTVSIAGLGSLTHAPGLGYCPRGTQTPRPALIRAHQSYPPLLSPPSSQNPPGASTTRSQEQTLLIPSSLALPSSSPLPLLFFLQLLRTRHPDNLLSYRSWSFFEHRLSFFPLLSSPGLVWLPPVSFRRRLFDHLLFLSSLICFLRTRRSGVSRVASQQRNRRNNQTRPKSRSNWNRSEAPFFCT